jgi:ClpP class serine protease
MALAGATGPVVHLRSRTIKTGSKRAGAGRMATFGDILREIQDEQLKRQREGVSDPIRRKYLRALYDLTGRNVVVYYSAFLHRQGPEHFFTTQINDEDKHGFMATFAGLDFDRGLDLILHSPGGDVAATESIIDYLRSKFGADIRTIVPQISMSGGTMLSLAGRQIVMGWHSNLGPIDPQIGGRPEESIIGVFEDIFAGLAVAITNE